MRELLSFPALQKTSLGVANSTDCGSCSFPQASASMQDAGEYSLYFGFIRSFALPTLSECVSAVLHFSCCLHPLWPPPNLVDMWWRFEPSNP